LGRDTSPAAEVVFPPYPEYSAARIAPGGCAVVVNGVGGYGFLASVSVPSSLVSLVLIAFTALAACVSLGGLYEFLVVDPAWPKRPGIIQPRNGGVSRARSDGPVAACCACRST
jgi:hypothetical protein